MNVSEKCTAKTTVLDSNLCHTRASYAKFGFKISGVQIPARAAIRGLKISLAIMSTLTRGIARKKFWSWVGTLGDFYIDYEHIFMSF